MKHKILMLGTYPIDPPFHGGQKRTKAIIDKYRKLGHEVKYISICTPGYSQYSATDFLVNTEKMQSLWHLPSSTFTEITVCKESAKNLDIVEKIKNIISSFRPTLVSYEQGYMYAFIKSFKDQLGLINIPIIFSAHNVEWIMKKDIALSDGCEEIEIEPYINEIRNLEKELLEKAELTLAVTKSDADTFKQLTHDAKFIIAPNGISPICPSEKAISFWNEFYKNNQIENKIIFVASGHPPNLHGLLTLIDGVGFLKYHDRIMVAGGVSNSLKYMFDTSIDVQIATLKNRMILCGTLSEDLLQGLITTADAIILPILVGGGSNLKTAEAIIADKPIIASTCAMRGYEQYLNIPNLYIADTADDFQNKILEAINSPLIKRNTTQKQLASQVLWDACLKPLETIFNESKFNV